MKTSFKIYTILGVLAVAMSSCFEEQDMKYSGPTVVEFKNYYMEKQSRLGLATFQRIYPNIVPGENTTLKGVSVRQPSAVRTGTITSTINSATVTGVGTLFTTELKVGSIVKDANGTMLGFVSAIANNTSLTLTTTAKIAVAGQAYRASQIPGGTTPYVDSVLVQLVGPQSASDLNVAYVKDVKPEGAVEAVEGLHFNFVRTPSGQVLIKGNSSSGYIYIQVNDVLGSADPAKVTLVLTLQGGGDIGASENYKTFTYNITY